MLTIRNLSFGYGSPLIKDLSFQLKKGEKTALIGANGSGKTTLFLLCCGILKSWQGSISVDGKPIQHGHFHPEMAYLFQSPDDQLFSATVFDDVAFGPLNMGYGKKDAGELALNALERVNGLEWSDHSPHHLSGGEKRMAAIATLLSMNPKVLLFDEPTANLDSRNRRSVVRVIQEMDQTMFISSHDLEFLLETCSQAVLMDGGEIIRSGAIRDIMADRELMEHCGLERPHSLIPHAESHHL